MNDKIKIRDKIILNSQIVICRHISKAVQSTEGPISILDNVNLEVNEAETIAVVGQSGSGKTTLLSLLAGLDIPTSGSIQLFQHAMDTLDEDARAELRNQYIGFVFQAFHLLLGMRLPPNYGKKYTEEFKQSFNIVAKKHEIAFVPFLLKGFAKDRRYFQVDGFHPTAAAQRKILANVWPILFLLLLK